MTHKMSISIALSVSLIILAACKTPTETKPTNIQSLDNDFERAILIVDADDGVQHQLQVYVASAFDQQRRGLMFIRNMPKDTGMLFIYENNNIQSMWMKNTYMPLDLIFARADGTVSSIIHNTQPLSLASLTSVEPITYVLELNAGTSKRLNIGQKSRIIWKGNRN